MIAGVLRFARAAPAGTGSWSMPSAALSAGVTWSWNTGPPESASGSQIPLRKAVACSSTSSPVPPVTGFS